MGPMTDDHPLVIFLKIFQWVAIPFLVVVHQIIINKPGFAVRHLPTWFAPKKGK